MAESEDDIWGYKSIRKKKVAERSAENTSSNAGTSLQGKKGAKKSSSAGRTMKVRNKKSPCRNNRSVARNGLITSPAKEHHAPSSGPGGDVSPTPRRTLKSGTKKASPCTPKAKHSGYCPSCQMPFSILLVQTPRWHVSECLDTPSAAQTGERVRWVYVHLDR